jgi:hypothetical protein
MFTVYIPFVFNNINKEAITASISEYITDASIQDIDLVERTKTQDGKPDIKYFIAFVKFEHIGDTIKNLILQGRQISVPVISSVRTKQKILHLLKYVPKETTTTTPATTTTTTTTTTTPTTTTTTTTTTPTTTTTTTPTTTTTTTPTTTTTTTPTTTTTTTPTTTTTTTTTTTAPIISDIHCIVPSIEQRLLQLEAFQLHSSHIIHSLLHKIHELETEVFTLQQQITDEDFAFEESNIDEPETPAE